MGQTCKRMNRMSGFYIREYHPDLKFMMFGKEICFHYINFLQPDFYPFIGQLQIISVLSDLDFFSNIKTFDALKTITFDSCILTVTSIESMQNILKNVEHICLTVFQIDGNVLKQLANACQKLKQLEIDYRNSYDDVVFSQHFPTLERFKYTYSGLRTNQLKQFLEKHTHLKRFEISWRILCDNQDALMQTNCQLDVLKVCFNFFDNESLFHQFINLLKTLHEHRFYKSLHLSFPLKFCKEHVSHAISILPQLQRLSVDSSSCLDLNHLTNLKELIMELFYLTINIEVYAKNLPNLEQLTLDSAEIKSILPFIRHSRKLKTIKIRTQKSEVLDLNVLNEERKKLENACKVSIYVQDDAYLPTKWKSHNFNLELDFIKILRLESFNFQESF